jgi:hypothetical protein
MALDLDNYVIPKSKKDEPTEEPGWFQPGSKSDAAVRGFANGATFGLAPRISALLNPGDTKANLKAYLENNKVASNAHPGISLASNIVGGAPALLATAGGSLARQGATNAAMGAVDAYGNSDKSGYDLVKDVATGGALGGVLATLPGSIVKGGVKAAENSTKNTIITTMKSLLKDKPPGYEKVLERVVNSTEPKLIKEIGITLPEAGQHLVNLLEKRKTFTVNSLEPAARAVIAEATPSWGKIVGEATKTGAEGVLGGVIGGGLNYVAGSPVDPLTAALGGAAVGAHGAGRQMIGELGTRIGHKVALSPIPAKILAAGATPAAGVVNQLVTQAATKDASEVAGGSPGAFGGLSDYLSAAQSSEDDKRKEAMKLQSTPEGRAQTNTDGKITDLDELTTSTK